MTEQKQPERQIVEYEGRKFLRSQWPSLSEIFAKGRELALHDGHLWDQLSGSERNAYYGRAERSLIAELREVTE